MAVWERWTEAARNVILLAQQEAQAINEPYVSTEHIFLGILRQPSSVAKRALEQMGYSCKDLEAKIRPYLRSKSTPINQEMSLTQRGKNVTDHACFASVNMGDDYIGTEHLLIGLMLEGIDNRPPINRLLNSPKWQPGLAAQVLKQSGIELEKIRQAILAVRGEQLLRASEMPVEKDELLRAAQENSETSPDELLRSSERHNEVGEN